MKKTTHIHTDTQTPQDPLFRSDRGRRTVVEMATMMFDRLATTAGASNVFARDEKLSPMMRVKARHPAKHVATHAPAGTHADFCPTVRAHDCS